MNTYKILIVEDEILIADYIERFLTKRGHEVVGIAISYEEAQELFEEEEPDLVLLDIKLNGTKTGIDFAHFIQQQRKTTPFIYLTSQIDSYNIDAAKNTFPAGYLSKPIHKESLFTTIEITMHKQSSQKEDVPTISFFDGTQKHVIPIQSILFFKTEHVYVHIFRAEGKPIIQRGALKDILPQLPEKQFIQTHRSFAINLKAVTRWDNEYVYIDENKISVSRSRRKIIQSFLEAR